VALRDHRFDVGVFSFGNQSVVKRCEERSAQKQMANNFHEHYFCARLGLRASFTSHAPELTSLDSILSNQKSITYTEARENLANTINRVCEDNAPVVITRRRDQAVVVLSLAEFESLQETAHLFAVAGKRQASLEINRVARTRKGSPQEIESGRVNLVFSREAWKEYLVWLHENPQTLKRINQLIKEIVRDPYRGIGKPEPLKHALQGYWSRRIIAEHRIVYRVVKGDLWIAQLRYYY
jgi:toxin YoeB